MPFWPGWIKAAELLSSVWASFVSLLVYWWVFCIWRKLPWQIWSCKSLHVITTFPTSISHKLIISYPLIMAYLDFLPGVKSPKIWKSHINKADNRPLRGWLRGFNSLKQYECHTEVKYTNAPCQQVCSMWGTGPEPFGCRFLISRLPRSNQNSDHAVGRWP